LRQNQKTELTVTKTDKNECEIYFKYFLFIFRQTDKGTFRAKLMSSVAKSMEQQWIESDTLKEEESRPEDQICQLTFEDVVLAIKKSQHHRCWINVGLELGIPYMMFDLEWLPKGMVKAVLQKNLGSGISPYDVKVGSG
jgi:hypothetical protein